MNYLDSVLGGDVLADEIDDFIDAWHESDSPLEIYQFLGMTEEEYSLWFSHPDNIYLIIAARHKGKSLREAVNDNLRHAERLAARADKAWKLDVLKDWIRSQPER